MKITNELPVSKKRNAKNDWPTADITYMLNAFNKRIKFTDWSQLNEEIADELNRSTAAVKMMLSRCTFSAIGSGLNHQSIATDEAVNEFIKVNTNKFFIHL
tara:strand:- start:499 stop:801 length:303 start_codon:yes stop_codon:yes gene_type:complete